MTTLYEDDYPLPVVLYMEEQGTKEVRSPGRTIAQGTQASSSYAMQLSNSKWSNSQIESLLIPTNIPSLWVPLRQVATLEPAWHHASITHYHHRRLRPAGQHQFRCRGEEGEAVD